MNTYIYIDKSKYLENSISSYPNLKTLTNNFTDYSMFAKYEKAFEYEETRVVRIIMNDSCYAIHKIFVAIEKDEKFIIVSETM